MAYPDIPQTTPPAREIGEIHASANYIGPVMSEDGSGNGMEISRVGGNGDWKFLITRPGIHMTEVRFPSGEGGDVNLFVGDEFGRMFDDFLGNDTSHRKSLEEVNVYSSEGSYKIGNEDDDLEVEVKGIEGIGHFREMFGNVQRFLDIRVNKDGTVVVTLRNRVGDKDATEPSTQEEIDKMPVVTASVVLKLDGEQSIFANAFANIARKAALAMQREEEIFSDWEEFEEIDEV